MRGWNRRAIAVACALIWASGGPAHAQEHDLHYCHQKFQRAMQAIDFVDAKLTQALEANDPRMIQAVITIAQPHLAKLKERLGECQELVVETCTRCELTLTSAK